MVALARAPTVPPARTGTGRGYSTSQLRMYGSQFGQLYIPLDLLRNNRVQAYKGSTEGGTAEAVCVLDRPCSQDLYDLLTKRFLTGKDYTRDSVQVFGELVDLAEFPLHDRKNCKKSELILNLRQES
jgi:hypothetical protein